MMKVAPAIGPWPDFAIEVDETVVFRLSIIFSDVIKYSAFVKLGQIVLEVEIAEILNIGCVFGRPAIRIFGQILLKLAPRSPLLWFDS
jgi:hypothetical protein